jgi:hypothetical protein
MAIAVGLGRLDELLNLVSGQVLAGTQLWYLIRGWA